ncbi:fumarylacetoacetase [Aetokthonos hydrillicola Thurmond2011]|jgi:fumarylacetoacetase|uniref:fumarylacetoacetase n=1 Tax=Aetokthonos hydrillicola Thurmond2011 TaxID=2712845 RepID=A0AAP5M8M6_9CYAN|nr:fumarylacetoacetase [Aetokthonos hydrillicola]MBO3458003.1 fumarylacetoacetase [Aetokthonos hydrillicola CCALA 1050]MBW4587163.1 fumarylacetoacetase [Aetokthonos hydrillicola CCALA 1050]MDR9899331.1 fumarylacetoacetase [Aetokthonos hydrillicola Thurmond2011]
MSYHINTTHNPDLRSWVESANQPHSDFPIQNLPFGVFRSHGTTETPCIGVAIGDQILNLYLCYQAGLLQELPAQLQSACAQSDLNQLMAMGNEVVSILRHHLSQLLQWDEHPPASAQEMLFPMSRAQLILPANIGDYTDFYASIFHALNVGKLFRPDKPILDNYKYLPIAYHGRASSIVPSDTPIRRPKGQIKKPEVSAPIFEPTQMLDYELEVGLFIGVGNELGEPISIDNAEEHIFGLCLVNDWSARDIQAWEYQPLGPFLAKSFATTISPWVVTLEALAPFRCPAFKRTQDDPLPLPYLCSRLNTELGGFDIIVEVFIRSTLMRAKGMEPFCLSRGSFKQMYWTVAQMLTHHTSNGCNLRPGDLLATGTISGVQKSSLGCLLEITQRGTYLVELPTHEMRSFLCDGDEIIFHAYCEKEGYVRIGFGECRGIILSTA